MTELEQALLKFSHQIGESQKRQKEKILISEIAILDTEIKLARVKKEMNRMRSLAIIAGCR